MKSYFLTQDIMGNTIKNALKAGAIIAGLATTPALAEANNTPTHKIETQKDASQKIENIACSTKLACEKLSISIQAQIKQLEAKGLRNLTNDEFASFAKLKKQLIAVEKSETAQEIAETKQNEKILAQLSSIKGSLLSK